MNKYWKPLNPKSFANQQKDTGTMSFDTFAWNEALKWLEIDFVSSMESSMWALQMHPMQSMDIKPK